MDHKEPQGRVTGSRFRLQKDVRGLGFREMRPGEHFVGRLKKPAAAAEGGSSGLTVGASTGR